MENNKNFFTLGADAKKRLDDKNIKHTNICLTEGEVNELKTQREKVYVLYKKIHKKQLISEEDIIDLSDKEMVLLLNMLGQDIKKLYNKVVLDNKPEENIIGVDIL